MSREPSYRLEFIEVLAVGMPVILSGVYALEHPSARWPIVATLAGGGAVLTLLFGLGTKFKNWCVRGIALVGTVTIGILVSLTGGYDSALWPALMLVTFWGGINLECLEADVLYILVSATLVLTCHARWSSMHLYQWLTLVLRMCAVVVPSSLYRHVVLSQRAQREELRRVLQREGRVHRDLKRRNLALNLFSNVALTLNSTLDLNTVLGKVIELTNASLGIEAGSVSLFDEESGDLVIRAMVGNGSQSLAGTHIPRGKGIASWVFEYGETALVHDVRQDPRFYPAIDEMSGFTTRSVLCIPLYSRDRVIGVIEAMNKVHGRFTLEDQQLLEALAMIAAPAIDNALLHEQLRQANEELARRYRELEEAQDRLIAAEKQATAMELAGAAAHELNQPLTVIQCSLDMIRRSLAPGHPAIEDVEMVERAAMRIVEIVRRIGSITRYRTRTYVEGIEILDLNSAAGRESTTEDVPPSSAGF